MAIFKLEFHSQDTSSCGTDSTGYSSEDDPDETTMHHVANPMIVVSNRLPFVLKRNKNGQLERTAR